MKRILLLTCLLLLGAAPAAPAAEIEAGTALASAEFTQLQNGKESRHGTLSAGQLHNLTLWLDQHSSHWHPLSGDASSEPIRLLVTLRHEGGGVASLSVVARADGTHYLTLTGPGRWAYRSYGGLFKSRTARRELSTPDFAALRELLGAE